MARDEERLERSQEEPIVGGLPDVPGILTAIRLTPGLGVHLRGLADELLVNDFPGATLERAEREMLATAVSAANDCFYCMDSHGAFATAVLEQSGATDLAAARRRGQARIVRGVRRQDARAAPHRPDRPTRAARPDRRRRRGGTRRGRDRCRRPARGPHRRRVLDVQPDGRRLPGAGPCRAPTPTVLARGRDRRARLQRPAGHVRPGIARRPASGRARTVRTGDCLCRTNR